MWVSTCAKYRTDCRHLCCVVIVWTGRRAIGHLHIGDRRLNLRSVALHKIGNRRLNLRGIAQACLPRSGLRTI